MFKKFMLSLALISGNFTHTDDDSNRIIALVAATTVCAGTGMYLAMREPNSVKISRAEELLKFYTGNLHYSIAQIATLQDMQKFVGQSTRFKKEMQVFGNLVDSSYKEIHARYGSFVKPWNWTREMKQAHERMKELHQTMRMVKMMFTYQPLMIAWNDKLDEATIVKTVQTICQGTSSYPMCYCVNMIRDDLKFLNSTHFKVSCDVALIDMLEKLKEFVAGSAAYVEEKRIQDEIALKERQAAALERQARAQENASAAQIAQASAQSDQARAQEERNRIEREKLNRR